MRLRASCLLLIWLLQQTTIGSVKRCPLNWKILQELDTVCFTPHRLAHPPSLGRVEASRRIDLEREASERQSHPKAFCGSPVGHPRGVGLSNESASACTRLQVRTASVYREGWAGAVSRQETRKARNVVVVAVLKYVGALRVQEFTIRVEHKEVGITRYLWVMGKKFLVLILGTLVDFQGHEVSLTQRPNVSVAGEKLVHDLAPAAPIAADYQKDIAPRALGFGESFGQIRARITLGVVPSYRDVAWRALRCSLPQHFAGSRRGIAKRQQEEKHQEHDRLRGPRFSGDCDKLR